MCSKMKHCEGGMVQAHCYRYCLIADVRDCRDWKGIRLFSSGRKRHGVFTGKIHEVSLFTLNFSDFSEDKAAEKEEAASFSEKPGLRN